MSILFSTLPATARTSPTPFKVAIPKSQLTELETLIKLSKLAPPTFENSEVDSPYGITTHWLVAMRDQWLRSYKWYSLNPATVLFNIHGWNKANVSINRKSSEDRINSFPQWTAEIEDLTIHFAGLFSRKKDAIPILLIHGWPGMSPAY